MVRDGKNEDYKVCAYSDQRAQPADLAPHDPVAALSDGDERHVRRYGGEAAQSG
jgi:hypothetical protein